MPKENNIIIHLSAPKDKSKWPEVWHRCYNIWKSSPYIIQMWYDEDIDNFLKEDDHEFFNVLNTLPPVYKFDYVRYLILEKFGGAYFDMDIEIVKDFLPLLNPNKIYFMGGKINEFVQNSIMINLSPNILTRRTVWKSLKDTCKYNVLNNLDQAKEAGNTINHVGPSALSKWLAQNNKLLYNCKIEYELLSHHHFCSLTNEISFARHHHTSHWLYAE